MDHAGRYLFKEWCLLTLMSWLSKAYHDLVNYFKKFPRNVKELNCEKLTARYIQVVGEGGGAEILAGKGGVRLTLSNPDKFKNHFSVFLKANGEINLDLVGPDGTVRAALDLTPEGAFVPRLSPTEPLTPPSSPETPTVPEL